DRYIAVIASRKRARLVLDFLREQGFSEEELARVRAPAGLDLGARTPEEIALSVLSEAVMLRRGASGTPMHRLAGEGVPGWERGSAPAKETAEAPR
ncbi:MAG: XdhC family protein, partial [Acetobacteraceae bacterium]|nr:XdhC family protein [Acetobacteraceae bacterium]